MTDPSRSAAGARDTSALHRLLSSVFVPLAVTGLAYALWAISDRVLVIGPFDRATFGWFVVIPVWLAAPVAAGFTWRSLSRSESRSAALIVSTVLTMIAAGLFWQATAFPDCEFGAVRGPIDWLIPSLVLGAVIGGGLGVSGLVATNFARRGQRWRAVLAGAGAELAMVFVAILVATLDIIGPGCQRAHP
jgi:hypothetical protein